MKKALIIATIYPFIEGFEKNNIKLLKELGYEVHIIASGDDITPNLDGLEVVKNIISITRNPLSVSNLKAYFYIKKYINNNDIDLVHCHTPVGGVLGRICNFKRRNRGLSKTIYTAHGFHFYKGGPLLNWILYYPIEKILSKYTDVLITINTEDYNIAKKSFCMNNLEYIPGVGIDIKKINSIIGNKEELCRQLNISKNSILLLSVGELNNNKNHKIVIETLPKLSTNVHYVICGVGPLKQQYRQLAKELNVENRLHLLGYRSDIIYIMKSCDIFVFPSKREGLSVALMEATASHMICFASKIRGNIDILSNDKGALLIDLSNFKSEFIKFFDNIFDSTNSYMNDVERFSIKNVKEKMKKIYKEI